MGIWYKMGDAYMGNVLLCFEPMFTQIRVCIASILKCRYERFLAMFAIKCASWTSINAGTSRRCPCDAVGFDEYASVSSSNAMLERTFTFKLGFPPYIYKHARIFNLHIYSIHAIIFCLLRFSVSPQLKWEL